MKSMAFIDYQNFDISLKRYFTSIGEKSFNVSYSKLTEALNKKVKLNTTLMKTYLFAYKPCNELMKIDSYNKFYRWLTTFKSKPLFEVIEGTQEIRQISKDIAIDINDSNTYTTQEKGTDINLAVNMLSKGYQNAYDVAILISGDTDYIPVVKELHHLGKIVVLATFPNQNVSKYNEYMDTHIKMDLQFLKDCEVQK